MTAAELYGLALAAPALLGIGRADMQGYLHLDVRLTPARWCYDGACAEIPWFDLPALV
jgi:hypothetical protein